MPNPGLDSARQITAAIEEGRLTKEELDICVDDLLDAILETTKAAEGHSTEFDIEGHHALAREAAAKSAVLLKNEGRILPLISGTKVAVIGDFAFVPRYQGAGSSVVNTTKLESFYEVAKDGAALEVVASSRGYLRNGAPDEALKNEAVEAAKQADVVLYFFGLDEMSESEGLDRQHMHLPNVQIDVLEEIIMVNPNVIGILSGGSSIEMQWETDLKAILHGYLTGQAGGGAIYDLLTGAVNPSGKLAETYPIALEDTPAFSYYPARERTSEYREGLYIGYRYYDTANVPVKYPFGYGLSYTSFEYSDLKVDADGATFTITNVGKVDGAETAQLYVRLPNAEVFRPEKELKGFAKVFLAAGETKTVTIPFDDMTFRYWNTASNGWAVEGGTYRILVGASSADIRLMADLPVAAAGGANPYERKKLQAYYSGDITRVPDSQFRELLGREIPDGSWTRNLTENDAICQLKNSRSFICRIVYKVLEGKRKKAEESGKPDLNVLFIYNMPLRAIGKMTGGAVSQEMVGGMVKVVNGHFFSGIAQVIGGYFRNGRLNKAYEKSLKNQ